VMQGLNDQCNSDSI